MRFKQLTAAAFALGAPAEVFAKSRQHWSYQGQGSAAHWAELDETFKTCKLGRLQSPTNIDTRTVEKATDAKPIGFAYVAGGGEPVNNDHTIQVNLPEAGSATFDGVEYNLRQFHSTR